MSAHRAWTVVVLIAFLAGMTACFEPVDSNSEQQNTNVGQGDAGFEDANNANQDPSETENDGDSDLIRDIDAGKRHNFIVEAAGGLRGWGWDNFDQVSAAPFGSIDDTRFNTISAGQHHTCAIHENGELHCWGSNAEGQVEDTPDGHFTDISAGGWHSCAIRDS